ncbi:MAG TPA: hypothetical protein VK477_01610, partial [Acidobacteriota bacterium]|nr:hypothetical protein [Acidobacteriota bacterium]
MKLDFLSIAAVALLAFASPPLPAAAGGAALAIVRLGPDGKLVYAPYNAEGDTLLDFSHCGYGGGGVRLPRATERVRLEATASGDDTARIQAALDEVAGLPLGPDGLRGAVVLARGAFRVSGTLRIAASGVVLRGEGQGESDTVVVATGKQPRDLISIAGAAPQRENRRSTRIVDRYVPVGARAFRVADASHLHVGQTVFVDRLGNAAWITALGMDRIPPRPEGRASVQWSPFVLAFDRVITAIDGSTITVDAPLACAIDERWGGGNVVPYADPGRISQ